MGDEPSGPSSHSPPSSSSLTQKNNLAMLYYGLVVVGTAAVVLALYNFLIIRWCARRSSQRPRPPANGDSSIQSDTSQSFQLSSGSFKYKKELNNNFNHDMGSGDYEHECSVCLSVFEEGEEVRLLPRCNHSFHALCIDMWLYSHHDCPLCRAIVHIATPPPYRSSATDGPSTENSQEGLLDSNVPV